MDLRGINMDPPEGHDVVVNAHCLPVFREDGIGLDYVWSGDGDATRRSTSEPESLPPASGGIMGAMTAGVWDEDDPQGRLKRLLKAGLRAATAYLADTGDEFS